MRVKMMLDYLDEHRAGYAACQVMGSNECGIKER
jgi:hypothetical protein